MKQVIAIHGTMGSGKSTVGTYINMRFPTVLKPFAAPIKELATLLGWNGKKDKKGRRLLQLLGTEVGRECISDTVWIDKWRDGLENVGSNVTVICDDLRFQNEYEALCQLSKSLPVTIVHVQRPQGFLKRFKPRHASERGIKFNGSIKPYVIQNSGDYADLSWAVDRMINGYL